MDDIVTEWIHRFTPILRYDSEEKYFPIHLDDYFNYCELRYKRHGRDTCAYRGGSWEDLLYTHYDDQEPNNIYNPQDNELNSRFYLKYFGCRDYPYSGDVPCYAYTTNTALFIDIVYFFPFVYSGEIAPLKIGTHDLDISHIVCRISLQGQLKAVYFSYHNGGSWISIPDVERVGYRPIVYVARWSHGMYPHTVHRIRRYYGLANDKADGWGKTGQHTAIPISQIHVNKDHPLLHFSGRVFKGGQGMPFFRGWRWTNTRQLEDKIDTGTKYKLCCQ